MPHPRNKNPFKNKNKYRAKKITIDGIKFDSLKEGRRYQELKIQAMAGFISDLKLQVEYFLLDPFVYQGKKYRGIKYLADFEYIKDGIKITEDVKGKATKVYQIKKKLLLSRYPHINFIET